jgi:UDP-glucose 6-dehydrogenase
VSLSSALSQANVFRERIVTMSSLFRLEMEKSIRFEQEHIKDAEAHKYEANTAKSTEIQVCLCFFGIMRLEGCNRLRSDCDTIAKTLQMLLQRD